MFAGQAGEKKASGRDSTSFDALASNRQSDYCQERFQSLGIFLMPTRLLFGALPRLPAPRPMLHSTYTTRGWALGSIPPDTDYLVLRPASGDFGMTRSE